MIKLNWLSYTIDFFGNSIPHGNLWIGLILKSSCTFCVHSGFVSGFSNTIKGINTFKKKSKLLLKFKSNLHSMYISCPECSTKFVVKPNQIGENGRNVKCSKCSHIWHQKPYDYKKIQPLLIAQNKIPDITLGNGVNLPALLPVRIPFYIYSAPVLLILSIFFVLMMMFPEKFGFDTMLSNKYLQLKDITIENKKELEKIIVTYKVINSSNHSYKMPLVRVRLYDKNNRLIKTHIDDHTRIDLAPKQHVLIKTEFVPAPSTAQGVDIMLGNKLDFFLR